MPFNSFDDMWRNMGIQPAAQNPAPANAYDPSQSAMWNMLNGRYQTAAELNGGNRTWDPSQHEDVTNAWLRAGMPSQTYQGINTVPGGQAATWNGVQTNNAFQDALRQQNLLPQGASATPNTMGQPGSFTNPTMGPNMGRTQQRGWGNNFGMPNMGGFGSMQSPLSGNMTGQFGGQQPGMGQQTPGWGTQGRQPWGGRGGGKGGY